MYCAIQALLTHVLLNDTSAIRSDEYPTQREGRATATESACRMRQNPLRYCKRWFHGRVGRTLASYGMYAWKIHGELCGHGALQPLMYTATMLHFARFGVIPGKYRFFSISGLYLIKVGIYLSCTLFGEKLCGANNFTKSYTDPPSILTEHHPNTVASK